MEHYKRITRDLFPEKNRTSNRLRSLLPRVQVYCVMSLNKVYLSYLAAYPLATKSVTAGVLATLNESIATSIADSKRKQSRRQLFDSKVLKNILQILMYASLFAAPVSHTYYNQLTRLFKGKTNWKYKVLQILVSLLSISPFLSAAYVSWIAVMNVETNVPNYVSAIKTSVAKGLRNNFWLVYRTSAITSTVAIAAAQLLIPTELWVVFFNLVFFILGTYQNTRMKLRQSRQEDKKQT